MSDRNQMVNSLTRAIPHLSAIFWGSLFGVHILRLNIQEPSRIVIYSLLILPLIFFVIFAIIGYLVGRPVRKILTKIYNLSSDINKHYNPENKGAIDFGKEQNSMSTVLATLITIAFILSQTPGWLEYFIGYFEFAQQISSFTLIYFIGMPILLYFSMFFLLFAIFRYVVIVLHMGMVNLGCSISLDKAVKESLVSPKSETAKER